MSSAKEKELAARLKTFPISRPLRLMEVCGTHTVAIRRLGIQHLLPEGVRLLSGPGCPVCVTPDAYIDQAVLLSRRGYLLTSFGDMLRVPGSESSLQKERAAGGRIQVVYSPLEALQLAREAQAPVVFLAVGFETTVPAIAQTVRQAEQDHIGNFYILPSLRLIPPALRLLLGAGVALDGLLLPGHVSAIIGAAAYRFLAEASVPAVISGFGASDILSSILLLLEMIEAQRPRVVNNYRAVVRENGNAKSRRISHEVFSPEDSEWRGIGMIHGSGLGLRPHLAHRDVRSREKLPLNAARSDPGCRCGDVLKGVIEPPQCPLFAKTCTPENPRGACMVSSEGSCQAWFRYA